MPNIMLFGLSHGEYTEKKNIIDAALADTDIGLAEEAVVTWVASEVRSCDRNNTPQPFVRVCSTGGLEEIHQIVQALKNKSLEMDCEMLPLPPNGFIEAKNMHPF